MNTTCNYLIDEKRRKKREWLYIATISVISLVWSAAVLWAGILIGRTP